METFVTILQVLGGTFGLALLGYGVAQVERFADTLEKISDTLDAQANSQEPSADATRMLLEKLDATIGRTYAAQPPPPVSRARTRTRKGNV